MLVWAAAAFASTWGTIGLRDWPWALRSRSCFGGSAREDGQKREVRGRSGTRLTELRFSSPAGDELMVNQGIESGLAMGAEAERTERTLTLWHRRP